MAPPDRHAGHRGHVQPLVNAREVVMGTSSGVTRFVTAMMGTVIGLTFLFGFGNVLALALRIGVPAYLAPLGRSRPSAGADDRVPDAVQPRWNEVDVVQTRSIPSSLRGVGRLPGAV